jgi:alkanesulfonate monooxygenase SsuD/methylene tetrahydromethanopterin reductase-like flavin-dependent oxidoreductase (luciferase family)
VRLGASLPITGPGGAPLGPGVLARGAAAIEEMGFASIWAFDSFGRGFVIPDPFVGLAVAAGATERVELGTGVLQLPLRNVVDTAHRILTLRMVAGPRVLIGVGAGSTRHDFEAAGLDFGGRFAALAEQLPRLHSLLATGRDGDTDLTPWPGTAGSVPLLVGSWRGPWVQRAADYGGWLASANYADDDTLAGAIERFRAAGGGRAVVTNLAIGDDVEPVMERIGRLEAMGFDDIVVFDPRFRPDILRTVRDAVGGST